MSKRTIGLLLITPLLLLGIFGFVMMVVTEPMAAMIFGCAVSFIIGMGILTDE